MNYGPFLGLFYTFLCSATVTLTSVFVKMLTYTSPGQLSLVRNAGVLIGNLPIAIYCVKNILGPKEHRCMLVVRGFLGATALYLNLMAFRYLPLAEAAIIMSMVPAMVTVTARLYLKESCGLVQSFALVLTAVGVILSIRLPELLKNRQNTPFDYSYILGLSCAAGCVIILSATFVLLRKLKEIHFSIVLLYFGFLGVIENAAITSVTSHYVWPICGLDPLLVTMIAVFGFLGHCFLTLAIQQEAVGIVSVMKASLDIVIAMIFQVIFFKDSPDIYNVTGALLVMMSVGVIGFRKWLITLPEESNTRRRLRYILL